MPKSKKKYKEKQACGVEGGVLWQSNAFNRLNFIAYKNQILSLALNRFKWLHLPPGCDERFLEYTLLFNGVATICFPKKLPGRFVSTQAITQGVMNVYQTPTRWDSFGVQGWRFPVDNRNGVLVYENRLRVPRLSIIDFLALELADIAATRRLNRQHQKTPFVITAPQSKELDVINYYKQLTGNEPAIIGYDDLMDDISVGTINTQVPFIGQQLDEAERNVWDRVYMYLGIPNMPYKTERQTQDEIRAQKAPSDMMALDSLGARREAAQKLNARFERYLDEPIQVVMNHDLESENYDDMHSARMLMEVMTGEDLSTV